MLVLLKEILKLILLGKRMGEKTVFRTKEAPVIITKHSTQTKQAVSDSPCIIHPGRLHEVLLHVLESMTERSCHFRNNVV